MKGDVVPVTTHAHNCEPVLRSSAPELGIILFGVVFDQSREYFAQHLGWKTAYRGNRVASGPEEANPVVKLFDLALMLNHGLVDLGLGLEGQCPLRRIEQHLAETGENYGKRIVSSYDLLT